MSLYTERHGMRAPKEKTYAITVKAYSLLYDCCLKYFDYLAWKYPDKCPDGHACCGLDFIKFNEDMEYEIPTLFRRDGLIDKPHATKDVSQDMIIEDLFDQYALIDLIEFVAQNIRDIRWRKHHSHYRHDDLYFATTNAIAVKFFEEINAIFKKAGLLYELTINLEVERIEETTILSKEIEKNIDQIKEKGLKELLIIAIQKHKSPHPNDQKDAVEKIWDALERLKTYYTDRSKKASVNQIVDDMAGGLTEYNNLFDTEFRALTDIGNSYRIRHHETDKIEIPDIRYYDYFFNRCLSLIGTAIQYLE